MDEWCGQQDFVPDGDRIYRCSKCGKRLHPRKIFGIDGELEGWRLPPHKKKGHKIGLRTWREVPIEDPQQTLELKNLINQEDLP